jgi:hypothetical protein
MHFDWYLRHHLLTWPIGHALRCAVDIGLDKALPRLATRLREGQAGEGEMDQNLVRASRTWCALFVFGEASLLLLHMSKSPSAHHFLHDHQ